MRAKRLTNDKLDAIREQKRKADEAWRLAKRLAGGDIGDDAYRRHREATAERRREASQSAREIGELPAVAEPARRQECCANLRLYLEVYHPQTFTLAWAHDHLKVIAKIERAVLQGGLFCVAMPRGSGKSSICEAAATWALLYGHRRFVVLIGAEAVAAKDRLKTIRMELECNDLIAADFPEVCYPIARLDRVNQRRLTYQGRAIRTTFTDDKIILPNLVGSPSNGGIVRVAGITGAIRGMKEPLATGGVVRPDFVLPDDPQTDESAKSTMQCEERERIIGGAVLGLAGPGKKIAAVMPVTVIRTGDVADRMLDHALHPEWQGERCKMLDSMPLDLTWWESTYKAALDASRMAGRGIADATELYLRERSRADAGAKAAWESRRNDDEASAIQHAMNLYLRDPAVFYAEYQNEPLPIAKPLDQDVRPEEIAGRFMRIERGHLPLFVQHVTAMIDVQDRALFWVVCGWADDFTGFVADYGVYPEQDRLYYTYADLRRTLATTTKASDVEGQIYSGLTTLSAALCERRFVRDDGAQLTIERMLVDANWRSDTIYAWCRSCRWPTIVTPSHGKYVGAKSQAWTEYRAKPGDRCGHNWRQPNVTGRRESRYVLSDANYWKSFIHARLTTSLGSPGALGLFGSNAAIHRLFAEHLTSETRDRATSERTGRTVDEWSLKPGRPDNHWLDCLYGCAVGASMQGCALPTLGPAEQKRQRKRATIPEHMRRG